MSESTILTVVRLLAGVAIVLGALGMLYCAPHLWSARMEDLVGAGFPFVGASILFGSGIVSLALSLRQGPRGPAS